MIGRVEQGYFRYISFQEFDKLRNTCKYAKQKCNKLLAELLNVSEEYHTQPFRYNYENFVYSLSDVNAWYTMIGVLYAGSTVVGYRLYDWLLDVTVDYSVESVTQRLQEHSVFITNMDYLTDASGSSVRCTQGEFEFYTALSESGQPINEYRPLTWLCTVTSVCIFVDYTGKTVFMSLGLFNDALTSTLLQYGVSNLCLFMQGKPTSIVSEMKPLKFETISSSKGSYYHCFTHDTYHDPAWAETGASLSASCMTIAYNAISHCFVPVVSFAFTRAAARSYSHEVRFLGETLPIYAVLADSGKEICNRLAVSEGQLLYIEYAPTSKGCPSAAEVENWYAGVDVEAFVTLPNMAQGIPLAWIKYCLALSDALNSSVLLNGGDLVHLEVDEATQRRGSWSMLHLRGSGYYPVPLLGLGVDTRCMDAPKNSSPVLNIRGNALALDGNKGEFKKLCLSTDSAFAPVLLRSIKAEQLEIVGDSLEFFGQERVSGGVQFSSVKLPDSVRVLGRAVFREQPIKSIILPKNLRRIGTSAFCSCEELEQVVLPEGLVVIGAEAFAGCLALKSIIIPASVRIIHRGAFKACIGLTYIRILGNPNIAVDAFDGCSLSVINAVSEYPQFDSFRGAKEVLSLYATCL